MENRESWSSCQHQTAEHREFLPCAHRWRSEFVFQSDQLGIRPFTPAIEAIKLKVHRNAAFWHTNYPFTDYSSWNIPIGSFVKVLPIALSEPFLTDFLNPLRIIPYLDQEVCPGLMVGLHEKLKIPGFVRNILASFTYVVYWYQYFVGFLHSWRFDHIIAHFHFIWGNDQKRVTVGKFLGTIRWL